jgi:class 3 adenylate cyclase
MSDARPAPLRPWQRLAVRLAVFFALALVLAIGAVGLLVYERQKSEVADTVGTQLLNIARMGSLLIDPVTHARAQETGGRDAAAYARVQRVLASIRTEVLLTSPIHTLAGYDPARRQAREVVVSEGPPPSAAPVTLPSEVAEPLGWTFQDGVARFTPIYRNAGGQWITAFGPILGADGKVAAVLTVDYPVEIYLDRLNELRAAVIRASLVGALAGVLLGVFVARRVTRPITALTTGVSRVAAGDLTRALTVSSNDEVGRLTQAFNGMLDGLRQRDFIRSAFGRYVSPEVAQTLLESPEGLRFGGEKRVVTILMSDLRGYTRFAEQGAPAEVMEVLNGYLARMTDVVIEHGGTINEFIGDAVFAVFGAPLDHPDHAERAAAAALAMQRAMVEVNAGHAGRGLPVLEMGIGVNTGEAVVGNIGSEQRAKYAVVGSAVNVAARVESSTVGGQVFLSAATWEVVRDITEVAAPVAVAVKGVSEPLLLYELRAISGRFAGRLPETSSAAEARVEVALPIECWVIDGKIVRADGLRGVACRLGRREIEAQLPEPLSPLTNVRLRLSYPGLGHDSGDLYGKVIAPDSSGGTNLTRIRLTWADAVDQKVIEGFLES